MHDADVIVIGAGPAGLAAAIEAKRCGASRVIVIDRDTEAGGILQQCIHPGFGLHLFKEELTGPEYAWRFIREAHETGVELMTDTMALAVSAGPAVTVCGRACGIVTLRSRALVLATGCRERTRGALMIPGTRPAGVMTAGTAQRLINMEGLMPGRSVVILGSGDIGLIMARRMTLEGACVHAVLELNAWPGGLNRNIVQCLDDFGIPLHLSATVTCIEGTDRVTAIRWARVDEHRQPIPGTEKRIACDTLLLSVGLIPENELAKESGVPMHPTTGGPEVDSAMQTGIPGIYACGNSVHVHDLADFATEEARIAGRSAAAFASGSEATCERSGDVLAACPQQQDLFIVNGIHVRYVVPQRIRRNGTVDTVDVQLSFRVDAVLEDQVVRLSQGGRVLSEKRRPLLVPGEMERVRISRELLESLTEDVELLLEVIPPKTSVSTQAGEWMEGE